MRLFARPVGPVGVAIALYEVWRLLPARRREQILAELVGVGGFLVHSVADKAAKLRSSRDVQAQGGAG
jgi:hypothetical protein